MKDSNQVVELGHEKLALNNAQSAHQALARTKQVEQNAKQNEPEPFTLRWYFGLYSLNWAISTQIIAASTLVQVFTFSLPLFYMVIFDRVFGKQNLAALDVMAIGMGLVLVFDLIVKNFRSYMLCYQTELTDKLSIENFLNRLFNFPLSGVSSEQKKLFASQFSDLLKVNRVLVNSLLVSWVEIVFSILVLIFIATINLRLALIASAPLIPISMIVFFSSPRIQRRAVAYERDQKECQIKLTEVIESIETVNSSNSVDFLKNKSAQKIEKTLHDGFQSRFDSSNGGNLINFLGTIGSVFLLYFGAHEVLKGNVTSGVYISINMLSRTMISSFQRLFYSIISFQEAFATLAQIKQVSNKHESKKTQAEIILPKSSIKGQIKVENVFFKYQDDLPWSVKNISLLIEPGQKVVFTGRSGSGKSTMVRLIQALHEYNTGNISLDGYNVLDLQASRLRECIGLVQQRPCMFSGTIKENIVMSNQNATEGDISEAVYLAGLEPLIRRLPKGIDTEVSILGSNIALDQAARISLARTLLLKPVVLIMDDCIPYLDITSQNEIYERIFNKFADKTCIFVTNYLPVHKRVDTIFTFQDCELIESGSYQELINENGSYARAYFSKTKPQT